MLDGRQQRDEQLDIVFFGKLLAFLFFALIGAAAQFQIQQFI
jgi:hypothetical protein